MEKNEHHNHDEYSIECVTLQPEYKVCDDPALIAKLKDD